ncbi:MAG: ATP-binding protein [Eggerthellaceae bacterium]|nr:ATP-binding protein [Eggerthellaceae bacterium]
MRCITVPATEEDPIPVIEFVEEQLSPYDCSRKALYQIEIAIEEIFVNIVRYSGLPADDGVEICCEVLEDPLRMTLRFRDGGTPFDPLAAGDPDISPEALEAREGGLGIFMVKQMMDSVSYAYEDGKNTLTLLKSLG